MLNIPLERSVDVTTARQNLEKTLREHQISWKIEIVGEHTSTAKCVLYGIDGEFLDYGYGKGDLEESVVGAMFEASEHWFCQFNNTNNQNVSYIESSVFAKNTGFSSYLPISILLESPNATMAFREYKNVCNEKDKILYPVGLSTPKYVDSLGTDDLKYPDDCFDYSLLGRYSTNSGVAIGSNESEATIHGLLEAVERDSLSSFLVEIFLKRNKSALRIVDRSTVSSAILSLIRKVEQEVKCDILLIELTNDFGIPVFCSALRDSHFPIEVTGYGCSLSRDHAAYRCLHELSQCYHATSKFHPEEFDAKSKHIISRFEKFPFHLRCAKLKIAEWIREIGCLPIQYAETANFEASADTTLYLAQLIKTIEKSGKRAFSSVLNHISGRQVVVHSFIEEQDYFFCVTEGSFVFPQIKKIRNVEPIAKI